MGGGAPRSRLAGMCRPRALEVAEQHLLARALIALREFAEADVVVLAEGLHGVEDVVRAHV
eukprot:6874681-Alexandrium_andersonii.AAC.1